MLAIATTIADLADRGSITVEDVQEALSLHLAPQLTDH